MFKHSNPYLPPLSLQFLFRPNDWFWWFECQVGVALCQIGCLLGMRVIMATSTQAQQQAALRIGAEAAFNVAEEEEQFKVAVNSMPFQRKTIY